LFGKSKEETFELLLVYARTPAQKQSSAARRMAVRVVASMTRLTAGSERRALERILHTPALARLVPHLQPELLHRLIEHSGLADCADLLPWLTPKQLEDVFDLDLWRATQPGATERFDPDRFGVWIAVLAEAGPSVAAEKLSGIDVALVVAGLAQHVLVFDPAAVSEYTTTDGETIAAAPLDDLPTAGIGGYVVAARRTEAWDAILCVLSALVEVHPACFQDVMAGCRALSSSGREADGLDDLLEPDDQVLRDAAIDRDRRRERHGYVTPDQARAFLAMSRNVHARSGEALPDNPIARAHFRAQVEAAIDHSAGASGRSPGPASAAASDPDPAASMAGVIEVLVEAGFLRSEPRALLTQSEPKLPRLARIHAEMAALHDRNAAVYTRRIDELVFLANTLKAGCAVQARAFTAQEAWDAAIAVCNLALEGIAPAHNVLADRDLVGLFQAGWTMLHDDVVVYAAAGLLEVVRQLRCRDRVIQIGLDTLRVEMTRHLRAGTPWRAGDAMDVLASLDLPAWVALRGLIDECPVIVTNGGTAFEFISERNQVDSMQAFVRSLGEALSSPW
jgi:hypothetical protein